MTARRAYATIYYMRKTTGSKLASERWAKLTLEQRLAWGKWLTAKRLEKRAKEKSKKAEE